jgi:inositol transport system ATP-binding protein
MTNGNYILEMSHVGKRFPGVIALDDINMQVVRSSVHVVVGENGAGKSTLMKIINGNYISDQGEMNFDGKPYKPVSPMNARNIGISMIFQELNIVPELTVAENIYLGREPMKNLKIFIDEKTLNAMAETYLLEQKLHISPAEKMKNLSVAQAQLIEIIKAISCNAKLIIMDEPTSAITEKEVEFLFSKIADLKSQGCTIMYISHKMDEIFRIADYISIFRDGRHIDCRKAKNFNIETVIEKMVGRELESGYPQKETPIGEEILRVEYFSKTKFFKDVTFSLHKGEILGFAGLMGAGRTELARAIVGLDSHDKGNIFINGKKVKISCMDDAINYGISMVSEDRRMYGIIPVRSVKENISLVGLKYFFKKMFINDKEETKEVEQLIKSLEIRTPSQETEIANLSGGNQQKSILARWIMSNTNIMILDEPTRGIDVGAKYEIYKLMCRLCSEGISIIMISSELPELIGMSDRIIVIRDGTISGEFTKDNATQVDILGKATGR